MLEQGTFKNLKRGYDDNLQDLAYESNLFYSYNDCLEVLSYLNNVKFD